MTILISRELLPESDIRVKSYDHLNFSRASVVQFRYIIGLNRKSESKVKAIGIYVALPCWISSGSIYYWPKSDIQVKCYGYFNLSRALLFKFSKNCWPESKIWVKSYGHLNLPCTSMMNFERLNILLAWIGHPSQKLWPFQFAKSFHVQIRASWYIIGLNRTSKSKVMVVCIWLALPCLISSVSMYYGPESDIRVKFYDHLNFSRAFVVEYWASGYIMGLNHAPKTKVMVVCICQELSCSNSSLSIYEGP